MKDIGIKELSLSARTRNLLGQAEIYTLSQILDADIHQLKNMKGMGVKSLQEILELSQQYGGSLMEDLSASKGGRKAKKTLLQEAVKEYQPETHTLLGFEDLQGLLLPDVLVEKIPFSIRTGNVLRKNGIHTLRECALMESSEARDFRGMGKNSYNEILLQIKERAKISVKDSSTEDTMSQIIQTFKAIVLREKAYELSWLSRQCAADLLNDTPEMKHWNGKQIEAFLHSAQFSAWLDQSRTFTAVAASRILEILFAARTYLPLQALLSEFPPLIMDAQRMKRILSKLKELQKVHQQADQYIYAYPHLEEWLDSLEARNKDILIRRLEGQTLEEIGSVHQLTRERVRQIINVSLSRRGHLQEDELLYWTQKYALDDQALKDIFQASVHTCSYIRLTSKSGSLPAEEMEKDPMMDERLLQAYSFWRNRNAMVLDGEYVPHKKSALIARLARSIARDQDIHITQFWEAYQKMLEESGEAHNKKLVYPNIRAFEARVIDNKNILSKYGRKIRYYPSGEADLADLAENLHLDQYQDLEISARKLFLDCSELMEEYDIHDEYELHNLLNKTQAQWSHLFRQKIVFGRMPCILIGNADREKQVEALLYKAAPISLDDFAALYEKEYGMQALTVKANMLSCIEKYYHQGMYTIDQPLMDPEEQARMEKMLSEDFYFEEDAREIYLKLTGGKHPERFNARTCKELGFKVYTQALLKNTWPSLEAYFRNFFGSAPEVDLKQLDRRLIYVQIANQVLDELRQKFALLEVEDRKFISLAVFQKSNPDIMPQDLKEIAQRAGTYLDEPYFTAACLLKRGFTMGVKQYETPAFLSGLLRSQKQYRFLKTGQTLLFSRTSRSFTTMDFLRFLLEKSGPRTLDSLIALAAEEYGINLRFEKILPQLKDSELLLDQENGCWMAAGS